MNTKDISNQLNESFNSSKIQTEAIINQASFRLLQIEQKYAILVDKIDSMIASLERQGLKIASLTQYLTDRGDLSVTLSCKPSSGKFRFIQFAGYKKSGAGLNEKKLDMKARKIEETILVDTGVKVQVNSCSLETHNYDDTPADTRKSVLIDFYL